MILLMRPKGDLGYPVSADVDTILGCPGYTRIDLRFEGAQRASKRRVSMTPGEARKLGLALLAAAAGYLDDGRMP